MMEVLSLMKIHPAAEIFPMIEGDELRALVDDIREHGLLEPIVVYKDQILDGRGRMRACEVLDIEPTFIPYEGSEPFAYSVSKNLIRRSLTASQKAAIAAEAREPLMAEAKKRQETAAKTMVQKRWDKSGSDDPDLSDAPKGRSREIAGAMFGVGQAQVGRAWTVKQTNPELFQKIKSGEVTVGAAHKEVTKKEATASSRNGRKKKAGQRADPLQRYELTSRRSEEFAGGQKRRLVEGLSQMNGISRGLSEIDFGMAAAVCSRQEIEEWAEIAGRLSSALRDIRKCLLEVLPHAPEA